MAKTVQEKAHELKVHVTVVKKFLRANGFADTSRDFKGSRTTLRPKEERAIDAVYKRGELKGSGVRERDMEKPEREPDPEITHGDLLDLPEPEIAPVELVVPQGGGRYHVYVHQDVMDWLGDAKSPEALRKTFTRRLQEITAFGRATRLKGVRGVNAGFIRVPLGGNSGMQYYLWLLQSGDRLAGEKVEDLLPGFPEHSRFLRLVRHHDEHGRLAPGSADDYVEISPRETLAADESAGLIECLEPDQRHICDDRSSIRLIKGQPGSGKTTSLLAATGTLQGKALYLTWSEALMRQARAWLDAYAPVGLNVTVWTFSQFVQEMNSSARASTSPTPASERQELFSTRLAPLALKLGEWRRGGKLKLDELYAELRAHYVGAALPVAFRERGACWVPHLSKADYLKSREGALNSAAEGAALAAAALSDDDLYTLFPEPVAAFERSLALQTGDLTLPEAFDFQWFLLDEVQDLTLAEQWLLVDVAARSGMRSGTRPGFMAAGDEAQTVRATAFEWGPLSDLLHLRLGAKPKSIREHELTANLRSPSEVAYVVRQARRYLYSLLLKCKRPSGRTEETHDDATAGRVLRVATPDPSDRTRLLEYFAQLAGDAALVYPTNVVPKAIADLAKPAGAVVWTPDVAKGLEFRVVGVLDVDVTLRGIHDLADGAKTHALAGELARSTIDQFLVSLSRSSDVLVLAGRCWGEDERQLVAPLLHDASARDRTGDAEEDAEDGLPGDTRLEDLPEELDSDAVDVLERIESLLQQGETLLEYNDREQSVLSAERAVRMLGKSGRPGAAGEDLRQRARRQLGRALAMRGIDMGSQADFKQAAHYFRVAGLTGAHEALRQSQAALFEPAGELESSRALANLANHLSDLTQAEPRLASFLLAAVVKRVALMAHDGLVPTTSPRRAGLLEGVHTLASSAPSDREALIQAHREILHNVIHKLAFDENGDEEYQHWRAPLGEEPALLRLDAQRREAFGDMRAAAPLWAGLGDRDAALRCWRKSGELGAAADFAARGGSADAELMRWAADLEQAIHARPSGTLSAEEQQVLRTCLEQALTRA